MSEYIPIKPETLTAFADQARRLGETENELSTAEMLDTFGNAEIVKNQDITITENGTYNAVSGYTGFGKVTVDITPKSDSGGSGDVPPAATAEFGKRKLSVVAPSGKSYFNGVLLPDIPADVLAQYPHIWMNDLHNGTYSIIVAAQPWYYQSGKMNIPKSGENVKYTLASNTSNWVKGQSYMDTGGYTVTDDNVIWSSHDIPNGSATATDIYFVGTEPLKEVVTGYGDFVSGTETYAVTIGALNELAHRMQKKRGTYNLYTGAEIFDFITNVSIYDKGKAESVLDGSNLAFTSTAITG